jgi:hypothetical protein
MHPNGLLKHKDTAQNDYLHQFIKVRRNMYFFYDFLTSNILNALNCMHAKVVILLCRGTDYFL